MSEVIGFAAVAFAGKELFKKLVLDVYELCKNEGMEILKDWTTQKKIETIFKCISKVKKVKTIWQLDKAVDLESFYCDSHVLIRNKRMRIKCISDFQTKENILIQGIAGQGKSILLRYICSNELENGKYIPIFVELNRVKKDSTLMSRILSSFLNLGLAIDEKQLRYIAKSGKMLLLLDAFDEISEDQKVKVLTDIEDFAAAYEELRIVITSRPSQDIQFSRHFTVVPLDNLKGNEYSQVIKKLAKEQAWANGLIDHIENKASHIKGLLCTPLMVTLLVISYKSFQQLPTKLSDFYDSLFQTLLQRHDGTKPGYSRPRKCELDDSQYRDVFEALCILGKKNGSPSFSTSKIQSLAKKAISIYEYNVNHISFVDDIEKITCLLIRDGEEHRFIHKTVQEYYTASYIQKKPETWAIDFYSRLLSKELKSEWNQEIGFLSEIDTYRYNRFYFLPWVKKLLKLNDEDFRNEWKPLPLQVISSIFENGAFIDDNPDSTMPLLRWKVEKDIIHVIVVMSNSTKGGETKNLLWWIKENDIKFSLVVDSISNTISLKSEILEAFINLGITNEDERFTRFNIPMERSNRIIEPKKILLLDQAILENCLPSLAISAQMECKKIFEKCKEILTMISNEESSSILDGLI